MARETMAAWKERAQRAERENDILSHALHCALHEQPDATERWRECRAVDGGIEVGPHLGRYTAALYRSAAAHGGIVLVTYAFPGQRPHTAAFYFDTWHAAVRERIRFPGALAEINAADRLKIARDRAWQHGGQSKATG